MLAYTNEFTLDRPCNFLKNLPTTWLLNSGTLNLDKLGCMPSQDMHILYYQNINYWNNEDRLTITYCFPSAHSIRKDKTQRLTEAGTTSFSSFGGSITLVGVEPAYGGVIDGGVTDFCKNALIIAAMNDFNLPTMLRRPIKHTIRSASVVIVNVAFASGKP